MVISGVVHLMQFTWRHVHCTVQSNRSQLNWNISVQFNSVQLCCTDCTMQTNWHSVYFIRPPGTVVPGRPYILLRSSIFFNAGSPRSLGRSSCNFASCSEACSVFIIQVQKFGGLPRRSLGLKTCWIWHYFGPFPSLTAIISRTHRDIQNQKTKWSTAFSSCSVKKVWWILVH